MVKRLALLVVLTAAPNAQAQLDTALLAPLAWRPIGPFRGGRTKAAAGVPSRPGTFYAGVVNGGVLRTTDYGRTWAPIFDAQPTGSVGAIAVAPSNPDVIYVGSGEGLQRPDLSTGDGVYRSADAGRTWTHLGLRDGQQIPQIAVDPRNPDRLFVAVLGHPYGPNAERGVFRSTDGGRTFAKVLYRDENTGAVDVVLDPRDANVVYAVLWESRQAPWENGVFTGPGSGVWKSADGGDSWTQLTNGLPDFADGLGRVGLTVAPSDPRRLFATVESREKGGLYRSDDAGATWTLINADRRVTDRASDFAEVKVDPTNADVVYTASIMLWKSTDGGRTFAGLKGAPGGDDYHRLWIDPTRPDVILVASDQGVVITVNGGVTWSSWYNQNTAQLYHVNADDAFPYRVCGGQQESGSACVASRGDYGTIGYREWRPVGVEEYGYAVPDPKDPDVIYGGRLTRHDRRTGQTQQISPCAIRAGDYCRVLRTAPVAFSPADSTTLYYGTNAVWKTTDGGAHWARISPDLTRRDSVVPPNVGAYASSPAAAARHPGVVYALAPSPRSARVLWAGTDDGLVHLTRDGGRTWADVTPRGLAPWAKVSVIDASPFDASVAYAAVNTFRLDDLRPHLYRTRDAGRTWTEIVAGIPDGAATNVIRADPRRRGLLYAGTEREVYVSLDDGDHWQSLRRDMPATSIRDLVVKDDDVVVGTHGRGIWIMDDVTPLRQIVPNVPARSAALLRPAPATRVRWNINTDTPLPPDEPTAPNPPDGAVLHYWLPAAAGRVSLEIVDAAGAVVRRYASDDSVAGPLRGTNVPDWWPRPERPLPNAAGMHRWVWDLRETTPDAPSYEYPIAAVVGNTPREPRGPWALPGRYTVRLTVDSATYAQPLLLRMDPRTPATPAALARQHALGRALARGMGRAAAALREARAARAPDAPFGRLADDLLALYGVVQDADVMPTAQASAAVAARLAALDAALRRAGLPPLDPEDHHTP